MCPDTLVPIICASLMLFALIIVFIIWKRRIWFYAKFELHPFDRDECENEGKRFDVFVSYSTEDSDWVREMIRKLEDDWGYRVCFHELHFEGGASIAANCERAVHLSKRTLCLISRNFLASPWCRAEFDAARSFDVNYHKQRLIVVKCEDVNVNEIPENASEIKYYLKNFTYIDKNSYLFDVKLKYVLPQTKQGPVANEETPLLTDM